MTLPLECNCSVDDLEDAGHLVAANDWAMVDRNAYDK